MPKFKLSVLILFTMLFSLYGETTFNWSSLPPMPPARGETIQAGVAGAFSGLLKVKLDDGTAYEAAVVAGGANFSEKPLVEGGKKLYHNDIFLLESGDTEYTWKAASLTIPPELPVAYGASCVYSDNQLLMIGGQNAAGKATPAVGMLTLNSDKTISVTPASIEIDGATHAVPDLPVTVIGGGALMVDGTVWVVAGKQSNPDGKNPVNRVFKLKFQEVKKDKLTLKEDKLKLKEYKLQLKNDKLQPKEYKLKLQEYKLQLKEYKVFWEDGLPLPGAARNGHITVAQKGGFQNRALFYVVSGVGQLDGKTTALTDGYAYLKSLGQEKEEWQAIASVQPFGEDETISLLGGKGLAAGVHNILFFGGYNKDVFNSWLAKTGDERTALHKEFFGQTPGQFKWNRKVLSYNTVTDTWTTLAEMPEGMRPNCGATAFKTGNDYHITGGEIMPGVRTAGGHIFSIQHNPAFGAVNWAVLALYLIGMLMLGVFFMRRENGAEDFMKGGGRIPWWAAGVSIFATMLSSLSFMAIPAMTYVKDWRVFTAAITITLCVPVVTRIYLPFFRRLNVTSAYEYLELRFNAGVRTIASFVFILYMVARIGIVLYLPSIALNAVTGIDIMTCIIVIGLITIVYCTMGGIEAVVWGDFIQGIVLILGAILAAAWLTLGTEGGFSGFTELAGDAGKLRTFDFAFDIRQPCFWVILLGGFFTNVVTYTSDQSVVQRYLTTKDEAGARKSLWLNGILCVPVSIVFYSIGSALYTFYKTHPAELNVVMTQADQIFPHFMMTKLPIGIAGLLIAAVFSATMSTLSSNINSAATAFTTDFYRRFFHHDADDHQALRICRTATVIVGLLGMGMAWAVNLMQSQQIFVFFNMMAGLMLSGLGAFFAMGILTRFVTGGGALLGFIANCFVLFYIKQLDLINGWLYSLVGMVVTFVFSLLFSLIFRGQKDLTRLTIYDINNMETK